MTGCTFSRMLTNYTLLELSIAIGIISLRPFSAMLKIRAFLLCGDT